MAEMLIDGAKLDACLDAEADAIRAKTGGSADIPFDYANNKGFADAIDAIPSGGGGSLPSVISKIDGGSFTLAASTSPENYWITHSLGVAPKGFSIWTNSRPPANGVDPVGFVNVYLSYDPGSGRQGYYAGNKLWHDQPTSESIIAGWITAPTQYADSTRFRWRATAAKYEAGVTYNWLAWA